MRWKRKYITDCKDRAYYRYGNINTEILVYANVQIHLHAFIRHVFSSAGFTLLCVLSLY